MWAASAGAHHVVCALLGDARLPEAGAHAVGGVGRRHKRRAQRHVQVLRNAPSDLSEQGICCKQPRQRALSAGGCQGHTRELLRSGRSCADAVAAGASRDIATGCEDPAACRARLGHEGGRDANERGQHLSQHALHVVRHLAQAGVPARVNQGYQGYQGIRVSCNGKS